VGDHAAGHLVGDRLYIPRNSRIHDLPAQVKILVALATVFVVVLTPFEAFWAFFCYLVLLRLVLMISNIKFARIAPRFIVEVPFVIFALLMPLIGQGPRSASVTGA
jgi:cobalt/nickel transport system permease protein